MHPFIEGTEFGSIQINGRTIEHDILIRSSGKAEKRKKKLSKKIYGTSHIISLDEAEYIYEDGLKGIIIGAGQYGMVSLSDEAAEYFKNKEIQVELLPTPKAVKKWNKSGSGFAGLFHVTC